MTMRVVLYRRVSHIRQERGASLETQQEMARAYCDERGWQIVNDIVETHSAEDIWEREGLSGARDLIRSGKADILLCHAVDRLTRNQNHLGIILDELERHGGRLDLVTEDVEATPIGKAVISFRAMAAEFEREKLIERTTRGMKQRIASGLLKPGKRPPFGYLWEGERKNRLVLDPLTAPIARRIFDAAARGESTRSIAKALNDLGLPTPTTHGSQWRHSTIRQIITNPVFCGEPEALKTKMVVERDHLQGTKRKVQKLRPVEERVVIPGASDPLIDRATFDHIQARLRLNKERAVRNARNPEAALLRGGFIRCGSCGGSMTAAPHRQKGTHYYRCARYIAQRDCPGATIEAHIIDAIVWAHAERVITDPQAIDLEVARMRNSEPPDHDIDAVERRIIEVERRQQRLARMIAALDDDAAAAPLLKELKDLSQQRKALDADRETVLARRRNWAATAGQLEMLREHWHEAFAAEVAELGYDERRRALDALGIQVRVYRKEHNPRWEITANIPLVDSYASTTMHTPTANTLCPSSSNRSFPAGCCHAIKVSPVPPSAALPNEPHEYQPCRPATPSGARMPRKIIHRYRSRRPRS